MEYFYKKTGLYIDWEQLNKLPEIDTLIDIGVGYDGSPDFYERFNKAKLILIDPLDEAYKYALENLKDRDTSFYKFAVGGKRETKIINVEDDVNRSTFLEVTEINKESKNINPRDVEIKTLDEILINESNLRNIGIKIDTEGYELNVIKGATNTLKNTKFIVAEVRHNHKSFGEQYALHEFMEIMNRNDFTLTMILTAKPLIADLCFQPKNALNFNF